MYRLLFLKITKKKVKKNILTNESEMKIPRPKYFEIVKLAQKQNFTFFCLNWPNNYIGIGSKHLKNWSKSNWKFKKHALKLAQKYIEIGS